MTYANHDQVQIRYEVTGVGEPLVLGHGFTGGLEDWADTGALALLAARYQVIALDLRGHGGSGKPHDPDAYGTEPRAGDVVAVLDALGIERAHYLGVSLGGWTGLCVAAHAPERLKSLAVAGVPALGQSLAAYRQAIAAGLGFWIALVEQSAGRLTPAQRARLAANDVDALAAAVARDRPPIVDRLAGLRSPLTFLAGDRDPLRPEIARSARALDARYVELPETDHVQTCLGPRLAPAYLAS